MIGRRGKQLLGAALLLCSIAAAAGGAPQAGAAAKRIDLHPSLAPAGTRMAIASNRSGTFHIWSSALDGTRPRELSHLAWDMEPAWSPDGTRIAFASYGHDAERGQFALWVMNFDGTNPQQLIAPAAGGDDQHPCWSPDSSRLAWTHGTQLWTINRDGTNPQPLTAPAAGTYEYCGEWSPRGDTIAYLVTDPAQAGAYTVALIDADGRHQRQYRANLQADLVQWSAAGDALYYSTDGSLFRSPLKAGKRRWIAAVPAFSAWTLGSQDHLLLADDGGPDGSGKILRKRLP